MGGVGGVGGVGGGSHISGYFRFSLVGSSGYALLTTRRQAPRMHTNAWFRNEFCIRLLLCFSWVLHFLPLYLPQCN